MAGVPQLVIYHALSSGLGLENLLLLLLLLTCRQLEAQRWQRAAAGMMMEVTTQRRTGQATMLPESLPRTRHAEQPVGNLLP